MRRPNLDSVRWEETHRGGRKGKGEEDLKPLFQGSRARRGNDCLARGDDYCSIDLKDPDPHWTADAGDVDVERERNRNKCNYYDHFNERVRSSLGV